MANISLPEICDVFLRLSERVSASTDQRFDPFVWMSLRRAMEELRRYIPGLDLAPNAAAARQLLQAAESSLTERHPSTALVQSLRGLAAAPHHPRLYYVVAMVCCHYDALEEAACLLRHALWIHPGYRAAQQDLEGLALYLAERREQPAVSDPSFVEEVYDEDDFDYTEYDDDEWSDLD